MGGIFGIASKQECATELFFGTDYHSHLGTVRGGLATMGSEGLIRFIHDISNAQFRSKFEQDLPRLRGTCGIGVISDTDDQPVLVKSHLGLYAIVTVGVVRNADELAARVFSARKTHFSEMKGGRINPTELVASLIDEGSTFEQGIRNAQEQIEGSCTLMLLTDKGVYAARDRLGRTPLTIGRRDGAYAVTMETSALPNLGFAGGEDLGPGEIVLVTAEGVERKLPGGPTSRICSFLWVYYGYPASDYEGENVEVVRNRCGAALAKRDDVKVDIVSGIPDSGTAHALGYAAQSGIPYMRPFVKYTPTWPRSFMPQDQSTRDLVARMKLIRVTELIRGKRLLFCEDSIVRGTQLKDTIQVLYEAGAREVHMRPACPPLVYSCKFLNFSQSKSEYDLAARRAIKEIESRHGTDLAPYADPDSEAHAEMVDRIRLRLALTTLKYQRLSDLVAAINLPKDRLCTYCWDCVG